MKSFHLSLTFTADVTYSLLGAPQTLLVSLKTFVEELSWCIEIDLARPPDLSVPHRLTHKAVKSEFALFVRKHLAQAAS